MRSLWKDVCAAVWMGMILPGIVLNLAVFLAQEYSGVQEEPVLQISDASPQFTVELCGDNGTRFLEMDDYLTGVVLAEMPASFHEEALKAQSVAARTYTYKACTAGGKHGNGSVCTDASCCQAYVTEEEYLSGGGTPENFAKVRNAVAATSGQVLTYDDALIEATYFSCSGGSTEAAVAVWGAEYPYLQAVSSPGEENALHYTDTVSYTSLGFQKSLGVILTGFPETWFGEIVRTDGGGVASITIGDEDYSGVELRTRLGLRSTAFDISVNHGIITITTMGYGHRVGMSQYGADAMADNGSIYSGILNHYYPGTDLRTIAQLQNEAEA